MPQSPLYTVHVMYLQFCNQVLINCPDMRLTAHVPHSHTTLRPIASFSYLRSCAKVGKMGVGETGVGEHARYNPSGSLSMRDVHG